MQLVDSPVAASIIESAQRVVDAWFRDDQRGPFHRAIAEEERLRFSDLPATAPERVAFRKIANAIRIGYGHATANPWSLLEIARRELKNQPDRAST
jgi:hypothetical protein